VVPTATSGIRLYIGQLKGVGKVWQITACDAFGSYGLAWLLPAFTAAAAATFLREILVRWNAKSRSGHPEVRDDGRDENLLRQVRQSGTRPPCPRKHAAEDLRGQFRPSRRGSSDGAPGQA
jgi:hypothetical protein